MNRKKKSLRTRTREFFGLLGPGLISGAADDDPSGIATYSQAGARYGNRLLWMALLMLPFMMAVQEACARIGLVTGKGLTSSIRDHFSRRILYFSIGLVALANTVNIGADIGAMAAAARLLVPLPFAFLTLLFVILILGLEIFMSYASYARVLKWLSLALLAYPLTLFILQLDWGRLLRESLLPQLHFSYEYLFLLTGVLGTTISPYLFFWQASQEVEERQETQGRKPQRFLVTRGRLYRLRLDNATGMILSELTTWSIIVVAATVLHAHGITQIRTSADAARALEPLVRTFPHAGYLAKLLFSLGIICLGLLAVPVLSGSAAYSVAEAFHWDEGLNLKWKKARGFYGVITLATLLGLLINFIGIDPIQALVYAAVFNGLAAVPLIYLILRIAANQRIMKGHASGWVSKLLLWLTFLGMGTAAVYLIISLF